MPRNKVNNNRFTYEEDVKEFTGLIFHCPNCDEVFHLHIAYVRINQSKKSLKRGSGRFHKDDN